VSAAPAAPADLVILGAGPAGVGAAYRAARAGHRVTLIERADGPGGASGSFTLAGVRVDHGSHRLHPSIDPAILADLRALLGDDLQTRPRNGRILLAGRWIAFPLRPLDLLLRLPPGFALRALRDLLLAPARRPAGDDFGAILRAKLGPAAVDRFYGPFARKLWGLEPGELSGEQARRRVSADSPVKLLRRIAGRAGAGKRVFLYPRRGYGQIAERLADAAAAAGARLRYGAGAAGVTLRPDGVRVETADGEVVEGRRLWSTIPLPALAAMADPAPPAAALAAAARLEFRALVLVYLVLEGGRYTPFDAHYLPEPFTPVTRISEPANYRDGDDPPDRTVLCAEIPCAPGDALFTAGDAALAALVTRALGRAGLPAPRVREVAVRRLPQAYPVYRRGFEEHLARLDAWAAAQPALLSFGRLGLFVHDNAHHALAMAWAAADALGPAGAFDGRAWAAARARFAEHVVED
jgi:protoporphyrinogen oxidase